MHKLIKTQVIKWHYGNNIVFIWDYATRVSIKKYEGGIEFDMGFITILTTNVDDVEDTIKSYLEKNGFEVES